MKWTTLMIAVIVTVVIVLLAARFYVSDADFTMTNPSWNGFYGMAQDKGIRPAYNVSGLAGAGDTLLIVAPADNYTIDGSGQVASFLRRGGNVIVMDDFGKANSLLSQIDAPIAIDPAPLCQYDDYYVNQSFPVISDVAVTPYTQNVSKIVLNHPAALRITGSAEGIAFTSRYAWLDNNSDYKLDNDERMAVFPVAAMADYGDGKLVVISDSDVFINSMLDKEDNKAFMDGLFKGNVWMDVSHGHGVTSLGLVYIVVKYNALVQVAILAALAVLCFAYLGRETLLRAFNIRRDK